MVPWRWVGRLILGWARPHYRWFNEMSQGFFWFRWRLWVLRSVDEDTFASKGVETRDDQDGTGHYDGDLTLNSGKHPASFLVALTLPDDSVFGEDPFHWSKFPTATSLLQWWSWIPFQMLWLQGNPSKGIDLWSITGRGWINEGGALKDWTVLSLFFFLFFPSFRL